MALAPYEHLMVLDFETAWCTKTDYTLGKMTTEEYVRDPRFKAWGMSYKFYHEDKTRWVPRDRLPAFLLLVDWTKTAVLCHNAQFDCSILSFIYDVHPCFIMDSLSMARVLRGVEVGNSLAKLALAFGLPEKGKAVSRTNGILDELPPEIAEALGEYCNHDVLLCEWVFDALLKSGFPAKELRLIDMTIKMFTEPRLVLDKDMLMEALTEEKLSRTRLLQRLGVEERDVASSMLFANMLERLGATVPYKQSKTTGKWAFAFAKTDALFQEMLNGDREDVAQLCELRLVVKSTQGRTRAQRFLAIAERGTLPVPLRYGATQTLRWGGDQLINLQNLKRGSFLRNAIMAPPGYVIMVSDLSQIEPRVLAYLAGYEGMLDIFRSGQDPYSAFGVRMFGIPGLSKESHPLLRQSAKSALLGAGYGLGWANFASQLLTGFLGAPPVLYDKEMAIAVGVTKKLLVDFENNLSHMQRMAEIPHMCSEVGLLVHCVTAKHIIDLYRSAALPVKNYWALCMDAIKRCLHDGHEFEASCVTFAKGEIRLPNGLSLKYPELRHELDKKKNEHQWVYGKGKVLHGGKLTENIVSSVARCVMADGMLRIQTKYPCVLTSHDEVGCLVREEEAEKAKPWVHAQMLVEPKYLPGIPLNAETNYAQRYGEAK